MTTQITIERAVYDQFDGSLEARITAFREALVAHAETEGVPAPVEDATVEYLARIPVDVGSIVVVDPPVPVDPAVEELARQTEVDRQRAEASQRAAQQAEIDQQRELITAQAAALAEMSARIAALEAAKVTTPPPASPPSEPPPDDES